MAQRFWKAIQFFILQDACNLFIRSNPMFHADGPGWTAYGWGWRALAAAVWGFNIYSVMMLGSLLFSAVCVACRISEPEEWPLLFGGPREAYSIRRFWGRAWHQFMRRYVSTHGKYLAQHLLRLPSGGNASAYVQLYTAFLISGLIHYIAETMALDHWRGGAMPFFMFQACAITVEDFILFAARKAGIRDGWAVRAVGYAWTWAWLALTLPGWQESLVHGGQMEEGLPVSVLMGVWQGEWVLRSR
ncbi:MBOAT-2 domain-containing protein [Mycena venus]|uniref:MBOAT-2 domain-containing protein n=1 Tax=Mycena venus TaxID=2733690 RepID=A0A8H7D6K5_9AGAR|nr:MBOAT-2 domain-containing protein [Mycena venus]